LILIFLGILIDIIKLFFDISQRSLFTKSPLHLHYFPKTKVSPRLLLKVRRSPPAKSIAKTTSDSSPSHLATLAVAPPLLPQKSIAKITTSYHRQDLDFAATKVRRSPPTESILAAAPTLAAAPPLLPQKSIAKILISQHRQDLDFAAA
jgi:hypothetical protein